MDTNDILLRRVPRRLRSSLVLTGGVLIQLSLGIVYTFGNLLPYILSYMKLKVDPDLNNGSMIWLQTLLSGIPFSLLTGGYFEKKLGARIGASIGLILYTLSVAASYYAIQHSFVLLLVTFGLLTGFGQGVAYNCVLINAQQWFPHRIGLASGVILGGFGCAAFVLAPIQTKFINPYNYNVNDDGIFTQEDLLQRVPQVFLVMAVIFAVLQIIGLLLLAEGNQEYEPIGEEDSRSISDILKEGYEVRSVLRSSTFALLFMTLLFNSVWVQVTSGLYKAYGQIFIKDDFFLAMVVSLASIFNCASRVAWGVIVDQTSYQTSMVIVCAVGAALMWTLGLVRSIASPWLFTYWMCFMFSCVGATYTLLPYATNKCFGSAHFGIIYGAVQLSLPVAGVFAALVSQFILPKIGYEMFFVVVGSLMLASFVLTTLIQFTKYGKLSKDSKDASTLSSPSSSISSSSPLLSQQY